MKRRNLIISVVLAVLLLTYIWAEIESDQEWEIRSRTTQFENEYNDARRWTEYANDDFEQLLSDGTKANNGVGSPSTPYNIPEPVYSGDELTRELAQVAETYATEYEKYNVIADEYYLFLQQNDKEIAKALGITYADEKKIQIRTDDSEFKRNLEKMTTELQRRAEREEQNRQLIYGAINALTGINLAALY